MPDPDVHGRNPQKRAQAWIEITKAYIRETGDQISSKQLQKKWHNRLQITKRKKFLNL